MVGYKIQFKKYKNKDNKQKKQHQLKTSTEPINDGS